MDRYVGAIDQGTTSTRFMVFDHSGGVVSVAQRPHEQVFPRAGWVEHDAHEILDNTLAVVVEALSSAGLTAADLLAVGITNQRETTVLWDRHTGEAAHNAIVWQDTRTSEMVERLADGPGPDRWRATTGLPLAPYFSGPKVSWLLENVEGLAGQAASGDLLFGTVDSWLVWHLTGGSEGGRHVTDVTNASRTLMMDLASLGWDADIVEALGIPASMLPEIVPSVGRIGEMKGPLAGVPLSGVLGDQQAALVGQACLAPGMLKSTYGTGCFAILNTGSEALASHHRLLTTIAYRLEGVATYALEGSIFVAGASVQWLRDELGLVDSANETATLAAGLDSNEGVYLVPAFTGLGAPYWNPHARGTLLGMTRATTPAHIARATLEAACYQSAELLGAMAEDSGQSPALLRIDGGMARNDWLAQFLADISDTLVERPALLETTALGAARLAGLQSGVFSSLDELGGLWRVERTFTPQMDESQRQALLNTWRRAVASAVLFAQPQD